MFYCAFFLHVKTVVSQSRGDINIIMWWKKPCANKNTLTRSPLEVLKVVLKCNQNGRISLIKKETSEITGPLIRK